jgi:hypothetical protein
MRLSFLIAVAVPICLAQTPPDRLHQSMEDERSKSAGCVAAKCHVGIEPMHASPAVHLGCTDCHGGLAGATRVEEAHVQAKFPNRWPKSGTKPQRSYTLLSQEDAAFVRFINPGDYRVIDQTCGTSDCHAAIAYKARRSLMTHGAFLWGAALYNNGAYPKKDAAFGESYDARGIAQKLFSLPAPTPEETRAKGILPFLIPLPQYQNTQPGNVLRVFERGEDRLGDRGFGTGTRTDPVFQGIQRTRLADPLLSFLGTNDHPGDYRSSGCTGCHVVYANDRDPAHAGPYAQYGHSGFSFTADQSIQKQESSHPILHRLTRSIPTSQCVVCHIHPGTSYASQYTGYMWWDNETEGELMYPTAPKRMSPQQAAASLAKNPESASLKGKWSAPGFLDNLTDLNPQLKQTQFADYHGHGWVFRAVYKHDRKGNWLDADDRPIAFEDPDRMKKAVHLKDIHLEKGMHCVDCHFEQDVHGNGKLYGEARAAVEVDCIDCHGGVRSRATLKTSNAAAPSPPNDLSLLRTPWGLRRFEWQAGKLIQRSMVEKDKQWDVVQVLDSITPGNPHYNEKARLAKTLLRDGSTWGAVPANPRELAHSDQRMACYTCHTSWMTSCFGCHLSMTANAQRPDLHWEGDDQTKNFTTYNFQVLRDDVFMLGKDSTVKDGKITPVRSSSAVVVSSQNANRDWVYLTQQTVSAEGYSGQAHNPHFPHTVRTRETRTCVDCHVSQANDNNAWMAQVLNQGTNFVNFFGRYVYVGEGRGFEAVAVTEHDEPMAVYGSHLHKLAYPDKYAGFTKTRRLKEAWGHEGGEIASIQLRGEYAYAAKGKAGVEIYDVANVDNKAVSERIVSAPVSPAGQRLTVRTKDAAWIALPSTLAVDPARTHRPENEEQPIHAVYGYLYVADREEGLVLIGAATLLDGDPRNNFLKRAATFNPGGALKGANHVVLAGNYAYVSCDRGLVIVSLNDPLHPEIVASVALHGAGHAALQFRYAVVCDSDGLKILDITDVRQPRIAASLAIRDSRDVYWARTYLYVAAGSRGVAIVDMENPERPGQPVFYNASGQINDAYAVKLGMTNASLFAYVADGRNGLRVLQMVSPSTNNDLWGFSPAPKPQLIATFKTQAPAIALSKGLDRDRAVDESGNQLTVFGRRGARPFNRQEMERLYLRNGKLYGVTNTAPASPKDGLPKAVSPEASARKGGTR